MTLDISFDEERLDEMVLVHLHPPGQTCESCQIVEGLVVAGLAVHRAAGAKFVHSEDLAYLLLEACGLLPDPAPFDAKLALMVERDEIGPWEIGSWTREGLKLVATEG